MNYPQLLQVIAVSVVLTVALIVLLCAVRQGITRWWQSYLLPRYLKPRGVRRRLPVVPARSDVNDPS